MQLIIGSYLSSFALSDLHSVQGKQKQKCNFTAVKFFVRERHLK
uniref:Uncharacterized protein n=1 Tax=Anguilla anguilla TaxID=7936 RepID=A0A0E9RFC3_ANGAN